MSLGEARLILTASEVVDAVVDGFGHCGTLHLWTKREERGTGAKMSVLVTRPAGWLFLVLLHLDVHAETLDLVA